MGYLESGKIGNVFQNSALALLKLSPDGLNKFLVLSISSGNFLGCTCLCFFECKNGLLFLPPESFDLANGILVRCFELDKTGLLILDNPSTLSNGLFKLFR